MAKNEGKVLVWLPDGDSPLQTPPMSIDARRETGYLLRLLQRGDKLSMPIARPMPSIGKRVAELRITDNQHNCIWRIVYRMDGDAIVIADLFKKKTQKTSQKDIDRSKARLSHYDQAIR